MNYKFLPDHEERYIVYENGIVERVCSVTKKGTLIRSKILPYNKCHSGYLSIHTYKKRVYIHRIVAKLFIENNDPENKIQVNHIDGDKLNNNVSNLEWVTPSENIKHSYANGRNTGKGISRVSRKVLLIKDGINYHFDNIKLALNITGGSHSALSHVLHGRAKTFKGYKAFFI